ncbi:helix-turn-helix domain-containing protein [Streptomyces melanosporofaciens]|uniref:helix-turn-helix domain-containing protein n=1 Tax=Streptomyces sp. NPDC021218 TaxID=3365119 RepID=UPI0037901B4B
MSWIREQLLEHARRDLTDPALRDRPVGEIAHRWGFTHHATFTGAFRARYRMTPTEYRNDHAAQRQPAAQASHPAAQNGDARHS